MSTVLANQNNDEHPPKKPNKTPSIKVHIDSSVQKPHKPDLAPHFLYRNLNHGQFKSPVLPTNRRSAVDFPSDIDQLETLDFEHFVETYNDDALFIFDIRPFNEYVQSHVKNAINLCVPLTLLKRKLYGLGSILKSIDPEQCSQILTGDHLTVIIYDSDSSRDNIAVPVYQTCMKFHEYGKENGVRYQVYYLNGGMKCLQNVEMLEYGSPTTNPSDNSSEQTLSPELTRLSTGYRSPTSPAACLNFSGFFLPSSTPAQQKFLSSIKRNALPKLDLSAISGNNNLTNPPSVDENINNYHYDLKIPDLRGLEKKLPIWLRFFVSNETQDSSVSSKRVLSILNQKFNKIEKAELVRLKKAISSSNAVHSPNICSPGNLCPACDQIVYKIPKGIEYGYKNRYNNVWPFEHSRVKLSQASPLSTSPHCNHDDQDDYFNANRIDFKGISDLEYIATQNPLQATYDDFWRTVWIENIDVIVCLNKQQENFGQLNRYFDDQDFAGFSLATKNTKEEKHFTVRELLLSRKGRKGCKSIYHLEFKDWPDFGVPSSFESILSLIEYKRTLTEQLGLSKRSVVHCSAGCGRTGCFITLDLIFGCFNENSNRKMEVDPWGDKDLIYRIIQGQRRQRISMVQTLDQFIVCYEIVLDFVVRLLRLER